MDLTTKNFLQSIKDKNSDLFRSSRVLEVGSRDVNGSLRSYFSDCDYLGVDIEPGPGVDIVGHLCDVTNLIEDSYDVILCTNVSEHDPRWRQTLLNCVDRVSPGGMMILVCPTSISFHQFLELERSILDNTDKVTYVANETLIRNNWFEKRGPGSSGKISYKSESMKHCKDEIEVQSSNIINWCWGYITDCEFVESHHSMRPTIESIMTLQHNVHMTASDDYYSNPSQGDILSSLLIGGKINDFIINSKYSFATGVQLCMTLEKRKSSE